MRKKDSGVTLLVLVITIVVLTIIASITVYEGKELIDKSKVQTLETNMLTIQAKAKAYVEEIETKIWTENNENQKTQKRDEEFGKKGFNNETLNETQLGYISSEIKDEGCIVYKVTDSALEKMGLNDIKGEEYFVIYNKVDYRKIEVMYKEGIRYNKTTYHTLSEIQNALSN